jgi:hypothetical protein
MKPPGSDVVPQIMEGGFKKLGEIFCSVDFSPMRIGIVSSTSHRGFFHPRLAVLGVTLGHS